MTKHMGQYSTFFLEAHAESGVAALLSRRPSASPGTNGFLRHTHIGLKRPRTSWGSLVGHSPHTQHQHNRGEQHPPMPSQHRTRAGASSFMHGNYYRHAHSWSCENLLHVDYTSCGKAACLVFPEQPSHWHLKCRGFAQAGFGPICEVEVSCPQGQDPRGTHPNQPRGFRVFGRWALRGTLPGASERLRPFLVKSR